MQSRRIQPAAGHKRRAHGVARLLWLLMLLAGTAAQAHKVNVFVYEEAGEVFVEGYFADGTRAQQAAVDVSGPAGEILFNGTTDTEGQLSFPRPAKTDLRIVLNAGMGHLAEYTLARDDGGDTAVAPGDPVASASPGPPPDSPGGGVDPGTLERVVQHAVAEAVKPLVRELAESREHASLTQIVGGVGYILGLFGLAAYLQARRRR